MAHTRPYLAGAQSLQVAAVTYKVETSQRLRPARQSSRLVEAGLVLIQDFAEGLGAGASCSFEGGQVGARRQTVAIQNAGSGVDLGHGAVEHPDQRGVAVAAAICEVARGLLGGQHCLQGEAFEPLAALQGPFAGGLGGIVQRPGAELKHPDASGARRGRGLQTIQTVAMTTAARIAPTDMIAWAHAAALSP